jgi:hypothetical protein
MADNIQDSAEKFINEYINELININNSLYHFNNLHNIENKLDELENNIKNIIKIVTRDSIYENINHNFDTYESYYYIIANINDSICMYVIYYVKMYLTKFDIDLNLIDMLTPLIKLKYNHNLHMLLYIIIKKYYKNYNEKNPKKAKLKHDVNEFYNIMKSIYDKNYKSVNINIDNILDDNIDDNYIHIDDDNKIKLIHFCIVFLSKVKIKKIIKNCDNLQKYDICRALGFDNSASLSGPLVLTKSEIIYPKIIQIPDGYTESLAEEHEKSHVKMLDYLYEIYNFKYLSLVLLQKYTTNETFKEMIRQ